MASTMAHEFSRCEFAFESFRKLTLKRNRNSESKLKLYNSYSLFITHLYEFLKSCFKRNLRKTKTGIIDSKINNETKKALKHMKQLIDKGEAPNWANDISYYEEEVPSNFGEDYRLVRNNFNHADYRRVYSDERLSLTEFYKQYHKFIMILYRWEASWWKTSGSEELNIKDINNFNDII